MNTYTGKELDERINKFLEKKTQRFPELQRDTRLVKVSKQNGFVNPLEKASLLWSQYIHA
jgi:hypothetical protein